MNMKKYFDEISFLKNYITEHCANVTDMFGKAKNQALRFEYSKGGEVLHRGYYCPSSIIDIVVGNLNRGRLLKYNQSTPTFTFGFDAENRIVTVENEIGNEYIFYNGEKSIGICFYEDSSIFRVSQCIYSNHRIKEYSVIDYNPYVKQVSEYRREEYEYNDESLTVIKINLGFYMSEDEPSTAEIIKYTFDIKDGIIGDYITETLYTNGIKSLFSGRKFKNQLRRKLNQ